MSKLLLSTKGQTLEVLRPLLSSATVLPSITFKAKEFQIDPHAILSKVHAEFDGSQLIVRSSSMQEDTAAHSNAGAFESVAEVGVDDDSLIAAIERVIASYGGVSDGDEVLIQPMLSDIRLSGVALTADIDTLAPYYIINYDESGQSDGVTSGRSEDTVTYAYYKNSPIPCADETLSKIISVCRECEKLFDHPYLDIEFALNEKGECFVFQVRPIAQQGKSDLSYVDIDTALGRVHRKLRKLLAPHPYLLGQDGIFGVMPDWNPAEIIGLRPRRLALSLYKELITDSIWAYQRNNYGYRNLRSHPLLVSLMGIPYIDVRVSFNSFVPKGLDEHIAGRLVNYYLDRLRSSPSHHDKVEFEIVFSCYYLDLPRQLRHLLDYGLNENEIKRIEFSLLELTNSIIHSKNGLFRRDVSRTQALENRYRMIVNSDFGEIEKTYWLIEDCKRYGTLPFAGMARSAFIAVQFLRSFVSTGIITQNELGAFMNSLNTVSKRLVSDLRRVSHGSLSRKDFLQDYGHLRPGTYDILSPRYDEDFDRYFSASTLDESEQAEFEFSAEQERTIDHALMENGVQANFSELIAFIIESIEQREYSKFVFTRSLSEALRLVGVQGNKFGIDREDISHLDIRRVLEMFSSLGHQDVRSVLQNDIETNKKLHDVSKAIRVPNLLVDPNDIYAFQIDTDEPTFVTTKRVEACVLAEADIDGGSLQEKIPFIRSADPGYDFLFTKKIVGLVTQYGGANSHMAIRCAELGIPAVIGAGERNFELWAKAQVLEIDCSNKLVRVIT